MHHKRKGNSAWYRDVFLTATKWLNKHKSDFWKWFLQAWGGVGVVQTLFTNTSSSIATAIAKANANSVQAQTSSPTVVAQTVVNCSLQSASSTSVGVQTNPPGTSTSTKIIIDNTR